MLNNMKNARSFGSPLIPERRRGIVPKIVVREVAEMLFI